MLCSFTKSKRLSINFTCSAEESVERDQGSKQPLEPHKDIQD